MDGERAVVGSVAVEIGEGGGLGGLGGEGEVRIDGKRKVHGFR